MIITIDGPAGSGKSTAARNLAKALNISFLDTGATYRAVTLRALKDGIDLSDDDSLVSVASNMKLTMTPNHDGVRVELDGQDVSQAIRSEEVSTNARYAANCPAVRGILVDMQRDLGRQLGDFVTEGRDQGTVVFPDADVKFYLDAKPEMRAQRRCEEINARGEQADYQAVLDAIIDRDKSDTGREVGPLRVPDNAVIISTSDKTQEQTLSELLKNVEACSEQS